MQKPDPECLPAHLSQFLERGTSDLIPESVVSGSDWLGSINIRGLSDRVLPAAELEAFCYAWTERRK